MLKQPSCEYLISLLRRAYWYDMPANRFCPFCAAEEGESEHEADCPAPEIEKACKITKWLDRMEVGAASD